MMQRLLMTRRSVLFSLAGLLLTTLLTVWGCGGSGSGSYTDPNSLITTTKASTIIDAATLKTWINEGKLNAPFGSKDRVVVVSPATAAEWTSPGKGHIPGAVRWDTGKLAEDARAEGLSTSSGMMPSGVMMDGIIQDLGIDGNTTIVISLPKDGTLYYQSLAYWDLRYWGFPKERIKILNAGDDAWEVAYGTASLSIDATEKYTKSTYSVAYNAGLKTVVRYNIGQMIAKIDETIATPSVLNDWQLIDVRSYTQSPYVTNALRMSSYTQFFKRLDAGDGVTRNYLWPDKTTLEARMADITNYPVKNGVINTTLSPTKKTVVMCAASSSASPTFVLFDAVLGVPEGNIAMYDGSAYQWNGYTADQLAFKLLGATATSPKNYKDLTTQTQKDQVLRWAFNNPDDPTKNRAQGITANTTASTAPSPALPTGFSFALSPSVNAPSAVGMTDQIDRGNQAYIEFIKLNSSATQNTGTGGSSQGC